MTVQEFYAKINGDYDEVLSRLMKEERILKYLKMFLVNEDINLLDTSLASGNYSEAFRAVHSIKGVALNLALAPLAKSGCELCETLRNGQPTIDITQMVADVHRDYDFVVETIKELVNSEEVNG